jgi:iron complex outermembrane receptor protein
MSALLGARPASAEPEEGDADELEVTVRGASTAAFTARASADTATREPKDAAALVAELPGVHVRRLGAEGSYATVSIRGSASTQVGVMLGGIPLTSAADPSLDIGALPLWPGATLRVYRGFAPAALGTTGYLGGVVAIDPPSPALGEKTEAWLLGGSFGTLKLRVGDLRRAGPVTTGTALFASRTDGDFTYDVGDARTGRARTQTRTNARVVAAGGLERATLERSWGRVGATIFGDARQQGLPGSVAQPTRAASLDRSRLVLGVDALVRTGAVGAVHAAAWGRREASRFADPLGEIDRTRPDASDAILAAGGSVGWRGRPLSAVTLDVLVDARGERYDPGAGATRMVRARRVAGGLGLDVEWRATRRLALSATGRVDALSNEASGLREQDARTEPERGVTPTGHVGASYRLAGEALIVAAHGGALERPPGFVELYGNLGQLMGEPSLRSERALSIDAGIAGELGGRNVRFGYEFVCFATSAHDLIAFVPVGIGTLRARNLDRATLLGAEASASLRARALELRASYTLMRSRNEGEDPLERGRPLPGRPVHDLVYDALYRIGALRLRYGLDVVGGSTIDTRGAIVLPTRVLHGAGLALALPWAPTIRLGVEVDNLFDLRDLHPVAAAPLATRAVAVPVSDLLGYPLPGRTIWASLRIVLPE